MHAQFYLGLAIGLIVAVVVGLYGFAVGVL